jgi:hypothetical protein
MYHNLNVASDCENNDFEQPRVGVESEAKFAWWIIIKRIGDNELLSGKAAIQRFDFCIGGQMWTSQGDERLGI